MTHQRVKKGWFFGLWRRIRYFREGRSRQDELRTNIERLTADRPESALTADESRRAHLPLGKPQTVVERIRGREFITVLEGWHRDFVLGLRALRKGPVFCLTAILTLALGIGANTAIFTLLYGLLLRSLPVADAHRLAQISLVSAASRSRGAGTFIPYRMLQQLRRQQHSLTGISAWIRDRVSIEAADGALRFYNAALVSGNGFQVLGMRPYLGGLISPSDDVRGGPATGWPVVLSYGFWKDHFGGSPEIIGPPIKLSNTVVTVIGVTPPDFHGLWPGIDSRLYLPIQFFAAVQAGRDDLDSPTSMIICSAMGRLKPGVSIDEANAEMAVYRNQLLELIPHRYQQSPYFQKARFRVDSARTGFPSFFGRTYAEPLYLMQALVGVVLLLCCVNVGGLMMSRVYARRHEFAVRTALGAPRWRLLRQYLTESFVLAAAGAVLGAAFAWYSNDYLLRFFRHPMIGQWMSVHPDSTVLFVTGVCALLTTVCFGMLPALRAGRTDPGVLLKSRTAGARRQTAGRAFVPVQVALSLVLVTLATLLSQSLARLRSEYTGFDVKHVTIQTAPFNLLPQKGDAKLDLYQRMVDRIEQMPGIESAAVTWVTPMTGIQPTAGFQALTSGPNPPEDSRMTYNDVGPGYFRTMKTQILEAREFEKNERARNVCILNQSAAEFLFAHQQAVDGYVRSTDPKQFPEGVICRVIGVAEDAKYASLREPPPRTIYFPLTRDTVATGNMVFLINAATKAESIVGYRKALAEIAPTVPLVLFATLQEQMDAALGSQTMITVLNDFFGGLALLLSAIGLYGLLASSVAQRTGEIGVRIALGAQRGRVLWMILSDALRLVGVGVLMGAAALFVAVRFVREMLYGVSAFDARTWIATAAVLVVVSLVAALVPALRAASVDPMQALRAE